MPASRLERSRCKCSSGWYTLSKFVLKVCAFQVCVKPGSHMSPTISELLTVTVDPENSQKILCIDSFEQSSSPTIATYEN